MILVGGAAQLFFLKLVYKKTMSFIVFKFLVTVDKYCLQAVVDFDPVDVPAVFTVKIQDNRCDTADTGASTRHSEHIFAVAKNTNM